MSITRVGFLGSRRAYGAMADKLPGIAPVTGLAPYSYHIEVFAAGSWLNITPDCIIQQPVEAFYGIVGSSPEDKTASAGYLSALINNDRNNSVARVGAYSPSHPSKIIGWDFNKPARLVVTFDGVTTYKWYGRVAELVPIVAELNVVAFKALDIMDDFARIDEPEIATQFNQRGDQLINTILNAMTTQPVTRAFEVGVQTFEVALDGGTGQKIKVRERFNQINMSEFGYIYPKGDRIGGGTLMWENRQHRSKNPAVAFTLSDSDVTLDGSFSVQGSRSDFYRNVQVTGHPTNNTATTPPTVLYALQSTRTQVGPGETNNSIFGPYRDPISKEQVGGTSFITLAAPIDFEANASADGLGVDLTAFFVVTASTTSSGVRFTITNTGAQAAYVIKLQQRGVPIYRYTAWVDTQVAGAYGDQTLSIDCPILSDMNVVKSISEHLAAVLSQPFSNLPPVRFLANRSAAHMHAAFELEPGDRIAITQPTVGLMAQQYTINSVKLTFDGDGLVWCTWGVEAAIASTSWLWGIEGSSNWGVSTYYGF